VRYHHFPTRSQISPATPQQQLAAGMETGPSDFWRIPKSFLKLSSFSSSSDFTD
jgi:hypothetical protein